jgi:hypothetical protein
MSKIGTQPAQVAGVLECRAPDGTLRWSVPFTGTATHQQEKQEDGNHAPDRAAQHAG